MTRLVAALIALLALSGAARAQDGCGGTDLLAELAARSPDAYARVVSAGSRVANGNAVLWRIERAGLAPSWLLGTIHMSDPRVSTPSAKVQAAIAEARRIALEIADLAPDSMMQAMTQKPDLFVFQDGRSLARLLSAEDFATTAAALETSGIPRTLAPMIRPWLAFTVLSVSACERMRSSNGESVLDQRIAEDARRRGVPVIGLETISGQLEALAALPEDEQIGMLRATLSYAARSNDVAATLMRLYETRQIGMAWPLQLELAAQVGIGPEAFATFDAKLVAARNREMAETSRSLLEQGGSLIAVGSLHLVGEQGLVALFQAQGYTLTAVD